VAIAIGVFVALFVAEVALRWLGSDRYYLWPPNYTTTLALEPGVMPGVGLTAHIRINSQGIRGPEWSPDRSREYRILAVGGSTTESLNLDQDKTWPALLQSGLRRTADGRNVWVGNLGKAGLNSRDHLGLMRLAIDQYDVDLIVFLIGGNDMIHRLLDDSSYDPSLVMDESRYLDWLSDRFAIVPASMERSLFTGAALRGLGRRAKLIAKSIIQDREGHWLVELRALRQQASLEDELPPLGSGLSEYERNVELIVEEAHRRSLRVVLLTQPTIWKPDMLDNERSLLWMGWRPDGRFYTTGALTRAMEMYNKRLLTTCNRLKLECVDLATRVPRTAEFFYDDMHFTEAGAQRVADELGTYLRARSPFAVDG